MEEQLKLQANRLEAQQTQIRQFEESIKSMMQTFSEINERLKEAEANSRNGSPSPRSHEFNRIQGYVPELDFPKFDGSNPRMWIKKFNKYFTLCT